VVEEAIALTTARAEVLERVAAALADRPEAPEPPRAYRRSLGLGREALVELFCERAGDYRADVRRVALPDVARTIGDLARGRTLVVPRGLPAEWRPTGVELRADDGLTAHELDALDGALTGCTVAIADTGTIVLTSSAAEGRRALTLVPDLHVCVVRESQIVGLLPEALELLERDGRARRPLTFVSGPSATSDIELDRVEGVHGPRTLVILVAGGAEADDDPARLSTIGV
jgi:L-lactate dehydrogenase complex protein LldG